jgi:glycerol-3-phosphate acyltransferase PlsY
MELFIRILLYVVIVAGGYFIGSISNAVIISNVFFRKDVRHYGSKNAGGSNAGRVFGKKVGVTVMVLDVFKSIFVYWFITLLFLFTNLGNYIDESATLHFAMIMTAVGHCYPVYYKFKGGKAVSVVAGFLLASNWLIAVMGFIFFITMLYVRKIVSFASIMSAIFLMAISPLLLIVGFRNLSFYPLANQNLFYFIPTLIGLCILLILKHRSNIERLQKGTENKIKWMK